MASYSRVLGGMVLWAGLLSCSESGPPPTAGTASGTIVYRDESIALSHAYVRKVQFRPGSSSVVMASSHEPEEKFVVLLTDGPVPFEALHYSTRVRRLFGQHKLRGLQLYVDPKKQPKDLTLYCQGTQDHAVVWSKQLELTTDDGELLAGKLSAKVFGDSTPFEAAFEAPVLHSSTPSLPPNTASGSFTQDGQTYALKHAYARIVQEKSNAGWYQELVLFLSDAPMSQDALEDAEVRARLAKLGSFHGLSVSLDLDDRPQKLLLGRRLDGEPTVMLNLEFEAKVFNEKSLEASLYGESGENDRADGTFHASIRKPDTESRSRDVLRQLWKKQGFRIREEASDELRKVASSTDLDQFADSMLQELGDCTMGETLASGSEPQAEGSARVTYHRATLRCTKGASTAKLRFAEVGEFLELVSLEIPAPAEQP